MPHIRAKSTPSTSNKTVKPTAVTRFSIARSPNWRTTPWPTKASRSTCGWSAPALARSRCMRAGASANNNTIMRIKNRLLKKPAMPDFTI
jgi:hypothetical protein